MEISFQLADFEEISLKKIKPHNKRAFMGYFLLSLALGQFYMIDKISIYLYSYYYHKSPEGIKTSKKLLSEVFLISQSLFMIPFTMLLRKKRFRVLIYTTVTLLYSAALASTYLLDNYVTLAFLIGGTGGLAQATVSIYPILEIRDYFSFKYRTYAMFGFLTFVTSFQNFLAFSSMVFIDPGIPQVQENSGIVPLMSCIYAKKRFALSSILCMVLVIPAIVIIYTGQRYNEMALNKDEVMIQNLSMDLNDVYDPIMPDEHELRIKEVIKQTETDRIKFATFSIFVFILMFLRDNSNKNLITTINPPLKDFKFPFFGQSFACGFIPFTTFPIFAILLNHRGNSSKYTFATHSSFLVIVAWTIFQVFMMNFLNSNQESVPFYLLGFVSTMILENFTLGLVFCFCTRYLYNRRFESIASYFTLKSWCDYIALKLDLYIGNFLQPDISMIFSLGSCILLYGYGMFVVSTERRVSTRWGYKIGDDSFIDDQEIQQMVDEIKKDKEISELRSRSSVEKMSSLKSDFSNFAQKRYSGLIGERRMTEGYAGEYK